MTAVTFPTTVGGDGSTVSDDANPTTGLANGGHRTRFVGVALKNVVSIAEFVVQKAAEAAASAASALGGVGSIATSSTTLTIGAADHAMDVGVGKTFAAGQKVGVARSSAPATTSMYGTVLTYSGSTLTVRVAAGDFIGSGTFGDWTISPTLYGPPASRTVTAAGLATGGGNLGANITITVTAADENDVRAGSSTARAITPDANAKAANFKTVTYGATVTWNTNTQGPNGYLTMGGNPNIAAPTNLKDGWPYILAIDQGAAGNRTVASWDAIFEWGQLGAPVLSTAPNKVDFLTFLYSSTTGKLHLFGFRKAA